MSKLSIPVLVVDDHATMRRILRQLLSQIGFTKIEEAADGTGALAMLRAEPFGLVISDWNMAPMSGIELLIEVRKDPKLKELPFILATAESKPENVIAAKKAGANNYIVKPFNAETLRGKIQSVLGTI